MIFFSSAYTWGTDITEKYHVVKNKGEKLKNVCAYGRKSADRTEHGNDVIFLVFLATVFGNLEVI